MELFAFSTWQETIGDKTFVPMYLICDRINAVELMASCSVPNSALFDFKTHKHYCFSGYDGIQLYLRAQV